MDIYDAYFDVKRKNDSNDQSLLLEDLSSNVSFCLLLKSGITPFPARVAQETQQVLAS